MKKSKTRGKIRKKPIFQEDGCQYKKATFTPVWIIQSKQNLDDIGMFNMIIQRKVVSASHSTLNVIQATLEKPICIRWFSCPVYSSTTIHPKGHEVICPTSTCRDGYLPLEYFLPLTFHHCFYFPKTGAKASL